MGQVLSDNNFGGSYSLAQNNLLADYNSAGNKPAADKLAVGSDDNAARDSGRAYH